MWSSRPLYDGRYIAAVPPLHHSIRWDDVALLVARLTLAWLFLPAGMQKLLHMEQFVATVVQHGAFGYALPYPKLFAGLAVVVQLGCGIMLALGLFTRWAALALIAFLAVATWMSPVDLQQNAAIAAGLLALAAAGGGVMGLDRRRRSV
jgi:putative oxidoreductase